jgi:small subunit ribosomal protein S21
MSRQVFAHFADAPTKWGRSQLSVSLAEGGRMPLRMRVHDKEPIGMALRRFKKLIERSGMQKELRARQHYEKPCEQRRRAELRKQKQARRAQGQI